MHPRSPCQRQPHFRGSIEGNRLPAKTQISKYISKLDNPSIQYTGIFCSAASLMLFWVHFSAAGKQKFFSSAMLRVRFSFGEMLKLTMANIYYVPGQAHSG